MDAAMPSVKSEILTAIAKTEDLKRKFLNIPKFFSLCQQCPRFGRLWSCPPYSENLVKTLDGLAIAHIVGVKLNIDPEFRRNALLKAFARQDFVAQLFRRVRLRFDDGLLTFEKVYPGALSLHAGACKNCPEQACARISGRPCRHPEKMRYSLESLGFDVSGIAREYLSTPLLWANDGLPAYFLLVGALFADCEIPNIAQAFKI